MLDQSAIERIARSLLADGFGMVILAGISESDDDVLFRCFSTISKEDIFQILENMAFSISMRKLDGCYLDELVIPSTDEDFNDIIFNVMAEIDAEPPIVVCLTAENMIAGYALGNAPIIVFGVTRMLSIFKTEGDFKMFRFYPSMN